MKVHVKDYLYLVRTCLLVSNISSSEVISTWSHPTQLKCVTNLKMVAKTFVNSKLTPFKWLRKNICKSNRSLINNIIFICAMMLPAAHCTRYIKFQLQISKYTSNETGFAE